MPQEIKYFGTLTSQATNLFTYDNVSLSDVLQDVVEDVDTYQRQIQEFFDPLSEKTETIAKVVNYFKGDVAEYSEAGRPQPQVDQYVFEQQVAMRRLTAGLQITADAIAMMTAEEVAARVQAKLQGFRNERFRDIRRAIFNNTTRSVVDFLQQYQAITMPFFNFPTDTDKAPPIEDYVFKPGDLNHYSGVAAANVITAAELRDKLIDKVAHHGFNLIEIWVSKWDRATIDTLAASGSFTPAAEVIGSDTTIRTRSANGNSRLKRLSPWEGLVGFVYEIPIIKTPLVPEKYAMAIGVDGGANRAPFLSRSSAIEAFNGLKMDVRNQNAPLEDTIMKDSWGYAPNHRGAVAVLKLDATTYSAPAVI